MLIDSGDIVVFAFIPKPHAEICDDMGNACAVLLRVLDAWASQLWMIVDESLREPHALSFPIINLHLEGLV